MYRKLMLVLMGVAVLGLAVGLVGCPKAEPPTPSRPPSVMRPPVPEEAPPVVEEEEVTEGEEAAEEAVEEGTSE